jgi:YegS/Rv2252/BmrU family lipid kinase
MQKISFIINPISGTREKDSWPDIIRQMIDETRFEINVFFTERPGHASELACRQVKSGIFYIVAVGGDGTVNEVAAALRDTPAVMGIIPCGSGNGLARHLQIPLNLTDALKVINAGKVVSIDYGTVNDKPFFCTFGAGFDAHISNVFAQSRKRGFMTYLMLIAREFLTYRSKKYRIKVDGRKFRIRAMMVTIANSAQFGNNGYISPCADITDGELDVCVLQPFPKRFTIHLAMRLLRKSIHKSRYYHGLKGEKIVIKRKHKGNVHLDGEPCVMGKKLKINIIPRGLNVMVKQDYF